MRLLRDVGFSSSQFLRYEPETSGIDVTLGEPSFIARSGLLSLLVLF